MKMPSDQLDLICKGRWVAASYLSNSPRISVIVSVHNGQNYIYETLESLRAQYFNLYEIVIVDDNSSDRTVEVVKQFEDLPIYLVSVKHVERSVARNIALDLCRSDYALILDADDLIAPNALEVCVDMLDRHPEVVAFQFGFVVGKVPQPTLFRNTEKAEAEIVQGESVYARQAPAINSVAFRVSEARFPPGVSVCEDWIFWRNMLSGALVVRSISQMAFVRRHDLNSTRSRKVLVVGEMAAILRLAGEVDNERSAFSQRLGRLAFLAIAQFPVIFLSSFIIGFVKEFYVSIFRKK